MSVHALVLLAGVEEQHPRALCLVLLQQRARLAKLRARALVRQPLRRREGSDKWRQDWIDRHGVGGVGAPGTQSSSGRSCTFAAPPLGLRWPGCSRSARGRSARAGPSSASRRRSSGPGKASSARAASGRQGRLKERLARSVIRARTRAREIEATRARAAAVHRLSLGAPSRPFAPPCFLK